MKKNWTCYVLQHTALYFFLRLYFQNSPLVVHLPWQHWIFPVPSSHTTDNLPRCDDGRKLGSNPVMLLICAKKIVCVIIFRLNACVNALTPLILSNCDFRFNNYNFISHNVKNFISHNYDYFSEFQFINHNCNYFYNTTHSCANEQITWHNNCSYWLLFLVNVTICWSLISLIVLLLQLKKLKPLHVMLKNT